MKVLAKIKTVTIAILITIFFAFALAMTILLLNFNDYGVTQFGDTSLVLIQQEITSQNYQKGDLVIVQKQPYETLQQEDEIFTYSVNSKGQANVEVGVIGELYPNEKAISFVNGASFSDEYIIGKSTKVYNNIGSFLSVVESKWGFLFMILVPGFVIFLYEVYALIVEIRYGNDEDE